MTTQWRFTSIGVGTGSPFAWRADMKAYSLRADRRLMYSLRLESAEVCCPALARVGGLRERESARAS